VNRSSFSPNLNHQRAMDQVKALLFDVFGTVVDWRSSVISELEALGEKSGVAPGKIIVNYQRKRRLFFLILGIIIGTTDWAKFAQEWRMGYIVATFVLLIDVSQDSLKRCSIIHAGDA
jgi:hypothetical protein